MNHPDDLTPMWREVTKRLEQKALQPIENEWARVRPEEQAQPEERKTDGRLPEPR